MSTRDERANFELAMHALLDNIIDGQPINFEGLRIPRSIIDRIESALEDGRLVGVLDTEKEEA